MRSARGRVRRRYQGRAGACTRTIGRERTTAPPPRAPVYGAIGELEAPASPGEPGVEPLPSRAHTDGDVGQSSLT